MARKKSILVEIFGKDKLTSKLGQLTARLNKIGARMGKIGRTISTKVTLPILAMGVGAVAASFNFNEGMANVATLIPGNIKRVKELKENVLDMSVVTGQSARDISDGLYQVISAYGDTKDTVETLNVTVRAGVAGQATAVDSLNLLSAVTKGYGDISAEAQLKAANMAFMTVKLGQTTFPELAEALPPVISMAEKLNVSQEELFTTFATLTGVTGDTSKVATQFAGVLGALIKPTTQMERVIRRYGFQSGEAMIKALGFQGALQKIVGTTNGTSIQLGKLVSRKEGLTAIMALTGIQADIFSKKLGNMKNSAGELDRAFKEQAEGINKTGFRFRQLKASVIAMAIRIGDLLAPQLIRLMDFISGVTIKFQALNPETQKIILIILGLAASIGPTLVALGFLVQAVAVLKLHVIATKAAVIGFRIALLALKAAIFIARAAWMALNVAFAISPIGAIVTGVILLVAATILLVKNWKRVKQVFHDAFAKIKSVTGVINKLKTVAGFFKGLFTGSPAGAAGVGAAARETTTNKNVTQTSKIKMEFGNVPPGTKIKTEGGGNDIDMIMRGATLAAP